MSVSPKGPIITRCCALQRIFQNGAEPSVRGPRPLQPLRASRLIGSDTAGVRNRTSNSLKRVVCE